MNEETIAEVKDSTQSSNDGGNMGEIEGEVGKWGETTDQFYAKEFTRRKLLDNIREGKTSVEKLTLTSGTAPIPIYNIKLTYNT
jgi:hypothetical protein